MYYYMVLKTKTNILNGKFSVRTKEIQLYSIFVQNLAEQCLLQSRVLCTSCHVFYHCTIRGDVSQLQNPYPV